MTATDSDHAIRDGGPGEPPAPDGTAQRVRVWLKLAVEGFSLLAAFAFLLAVARNEFLFSRWGLSFLQVASPSDVVMSGLGALFHFSSLVVLVAVGAVPGLLTRRVRELWWALFLLEGAAWIVLAVVVALLASGEGRDWGAGVTILLTLTLVPISHLLTHRRRREVLARPVARAALVLLVAASVLAFAALQIREQAAVGVTEKRIHLLQPRIPDCHGLVLWQGERATVVDCGYARGGTKPRVIYNAQDLMVTNASVPHPEDPPAKAAPAAAPQPAR